MIYILVLHVSFSVLIGARTESSCMINNHSFEQMDYYNGYFYTSGAHCVCRFNMSLYKELCDGTPGQSKIKYQSLLLVDKDNDTLLVCGTGSEVTCQVKDLQTLESLRNYTKSNNDDRSIMNSTIIAGGIGSGRKVFAFISWGERGGQNETVLYTATNTNNDNKLSPLSVRRLRGENILQLYNQNGFGSRIELVDNTSITNSYLTNFDPVGGFAYDGKAYFLANQLKDSQKINQQPKLIRLCQDDQGTNQWLSYKDIAITCQQSDHQNVNNRVYIANLMPLGRNVRSLNKNDTHVMAALFYRNNNPSLAYSLCTYTFDTIGTAFDETSSQVLDSKRYLKPTDTSNCKKVPTPSCNKSPDCRNSILNGNITGGPILTFESNNFPLMTSETIISGMFTVVLISNDSYVNVYYLKGPSDLSLVLIREIHVENKPRVMKLMDDEVYILIAAKVIRRSLYNSSNCESYASAHSCIRQEDPFCGWCRAEARCMMMRECADEESWLPITTVPDTLGEFSIKSVEPARGPISGGTSVTIRGENFDLFRKIDIIIGDRSCTCFTNTESVRNETTFTCLTPSSPQPDVLNISYTLSDDAGSNHINHTFEYLEDPTVSGISPNRSFASGGRTLTIVGTNFDIIQNPRIQIVGENISEGCDHTSNKSIITCTAPEATEDLKKKLEEEKGEGTSCGSVDILCVDVEFQMDGVNKSLLRQTLELARDPVFYNFTEEGMTKQYSSDSRFIVIKGDRINISAKAADFDVTIGDRICDVLPRKVYRYEFHCLPPAQQPKPLKSDSKDPEVWVRLGYIERHVGFLHYLPPEEEHYVYLYILVGVLCVIVLALVLIGVLLRRRSRRTVKKLQNDMQDMEMRIQTEFRQAFADLQTDMTDITGELVETGLPYNKFPVYAFQILFPADDVTDMTSHKIFHYPETSHDITDVDMGMMKLDELFQNKFFVLSVIDTLEKEKKLSLSEKASLASCVSTLLVQDLNLFSQLVRGLLKQHVTDVVLKKKHKSLFRRCQSITENMTEMWIGVCLYEHLLESRGGSALIMLVKAIQTVMMKSPIDDVTDAARATLSYEQLLLCQVDDDNVIRFQVMINDGEYQCSCVALACDSIGQVKAKCLEVMYKKDPASRRPTKNDVELLWHTGKQDRLILEEHDTRPSGENCVKLMTLADYHVTDGALMELLNKQINDDDEENYANLQDSRVSQSDVYVLLEDQTEEQDKEEEIHSSQDKVEYHLNNPEGEAIEKTKVLPEVHLNRLLQMKLNVKQYVDEALDSALDRNDIPAVVKFVFSVLDELAAGLGVDNGTLVSWKNNCYPIRVWGMLMQKPGILFDVDVPGYLQPSLDVVSTTFLDSFGPAHSLSKNSAPHKLLFYKDLEDYRQWVKTFHRAVNNTPSPDEREFAQHMNKLTYDQKFTVNRTSVLYEIYKVLVNFKKDIVDGLEEDRDASRLNLPEMLEHVFDLMETT